MGGYRWAYNKAIDYCLEKKGHNYKAMRKGWKARMVAESPWIKDIAAHTIYGAMMDAAKDYTGFVIKLKQKQKSRTPRKRKRTQRSFYILGNAITKKGIYSRLLGKMASAEPLPDKPMDSRILYVAGKWYVRIPETTTTARISENQARVVSIDYGVRTFLTCFSPNGIHKIADGSFTRIVRLLLWMDKLQSKISKAPCQQKRRLRLALQRHIKRVQDLIEDLHYQAISFLTDNYEIIIVPDNNFTTAVSKLKRKIRSKTVRSLLGYSFATFTRRLQHKCLLKGKQMVKVCESYTSKTANWTGEIIANLGGSKFITSGGIKVDRDINGALGVMLKALLAQPLNKSIC